MIYHSFGSITLFQRAVSVDIQKDAVAALLLKGASDLVRDLEIVDHIQLPPCLSKFRLECPRGIARGFETEELDGVCFRREPFRLFRLVFDRLVSGVDRHAS